MKTRRFNLLSAMLLLGVLCLGFASCGGDDDDGDGGGGQGGDVNGIVETLRQYKWETTTDDWTVGDDWILGNEYNVTIYFMTDSYGVIRLSNRTYDSDEGVSLDVKPYAFTYEVNGNTVDILLENGEEWDPLTYSHNRLVQGGTVFEAKERTADDNVWLAKHGPKTGKCGDGLTYIYTELSRTLTISGDGEMYDYNAGGQPWDGYYIEYVVIEEGVTSVGANAFNGFWNVGEVEMPKTLTKIGSLAFQGTLLSEVYLPDAVKEIGMGAFSGCSYLKDFHFDKEKSKLETIGDDAFLGSPLKFYNLTLPANLRHIGRMAFMDATFTLLALNEKLETIGTACFMGVKDDLVIPNSVKSIDAMAFNGSFNKVTIGTGLEELGDYAFASTARSGKMYINRSVPPATDGDVIGDNMERNWTLYVPVGAKSTYSRTAPWSEFKSIIEDASLEGGDGEAGEDGTTGDESGDISYTGTVQGHHYVDLGLSVKWATCNVGATEPSEYGGLYGWGDATGNKVSIDLDDYPSANPPMDISGTQYDIAYKKWGNKWRMPTSDELRELVSECSWTEKTLNGVDGVECTGPNGNSIFFPYGGHRDGSTVKNKGFYGDYWSSTRGEGSWKPEIGIQYATHMILYSSTNVIVNASSKRYMGHSVRPVTD